MFSNDTRILVVDDVSALRLHVANQLKWMGFKEIEQAENGQIAFELLEKRRQQNQFFQLIISDWNMPVMTGIEFLKKVRSTEAYAKTPFVMLTSEVEKAEVIRALKSGVSDYLVKPIDKDLLQQKLLAVWAKAST